MASPRRPEGFDSLYEALVKAIETPQPQAAFGCKPFTPDRDFTRSTPTAPLVRTSDTWSDPKYPISPTGQRPPARGLCPICRRPLHLPGPTPDADGPDYLDCAGCNRASRRVDADLADQLRRDRQRQHRINHNRELTAGTPTPAVLIEAEQATVPTPGKRRRSVLVASSPPLTS